MFYPTTSALILGAVMANLSLILASPLSSQLHGRAVTELNREATEEAHKRDASATRAFSGVEIKASNGQCLFIDQLSGDFRANLTPIQLAACDGSAGQSWDIITEGLHNNIAGKMLVVNTLTQACLDLNQGRVGREVTAFSCGGRAAGEGVVSVDQLFPVPASASSFTLTTERGNATSKCIGVVGSTLGVTNCNNASAAQRFSIANGESGDNRPDQSNPGTTSTSAGVTSPTTEPVLNETNVASCTITTQARPETVTVTHTVTAAAITGATFAYRN